MARGRKAANGTPPAAGHNGGPSRATFLEHVDLITEKLATKKSADSALAAAYKAAERDGLDRKDLKFAIAEAGRSSDEREVSHRRRMEYMAWLGKPVGTQAEMPLDGQGSEAGREVDPEADAAEAAAVEKHENNIAFTDGVKAGKAGAQAASNPYPPGSEQMQAWSSGWASGQKEAVMALGGATRTVAAEQTF